MTRMTYIAPVQQVIADDNRRFALMQREVLTEANKLDIEVTVIHGDYMSVNSKDNEVFAEIVSTAYNTAYGAMS